MIIGITGSLRWEDKFKIKNSIFELRNRFKNELTIVTRGNINGADFLTKSICLELSIEYREVLMPHQSWNSHCIDAPMRYNKPYKVQNFFVQNKKFTEFCDYFLVFWCDSDNTTPTQNDLLKKISKSEKKYLIIK